MLTIEGLSVGYGPARVVEDVSFTVANGAVTALLGRNGAGKSTLLKALAGLVPARAGRVRLDDRDLSGLRPHQRCRLGLGYVPEERRIFSRLTVRENLDVGTRPARGVLPAWTHDRILALFPTLSTLLHRRGGEISGGEQQMLTIARTLMGNPRVLLLDEPSTGLAPKVLADLARAVGSLKAAGLTVLLSEQSLAFAEAIADHALILETGRLLWSGSLPELVADPDLKRAYLSV